MTDTQTKRSSGGQHHRDRTHPKRSECCGLLVLPRFHSSTTTNNNNNNERSSAYHPRTLALRCLYQSQYRRKCTISHTLKQHLSVRANRKGPSPNISCAEGKGGFTWIIPPQLGAQNRGRENKTPKILHLGSPRATQSSCIRSIDSLIELSTR